MLSIRVASAQLAIAVLLFAATGALAADFSVP
jgi:hypothetical protein